MRLPFMGSSVDHLSVYATSVITAKRRQWGINMTAAADELIRLAEAMSAVWATQSLSQLWPKVAELGLLNTTATLDPTPTAAQSRPAPQLPNLHPLLTEPNVSDDTVWEWAALLYWAPALGPGAPMGEVPTRHMATISKTLQSAKDAIHPGWAHAADVTKVIARFQDWIAGPASQANDQIADMASRWRQQLEIARQSTRSQALTYMSRAQAMLESGDVAEAPDSTPVRAAFNECREFCLQLPTAVVAIEPNPVGAR